MPASWATSWRRSPGVRRRPAAPAAGRPAWRGLSRARRARRNAASSARFAESMTPSVAAGRPAKVGPLIPGTAGLSPPRLGRPRAGGRAAGGVGARDEGRGLEAERGLQAGGADATFVRLAVTDLESVREAAG